MNPWFRRKDSSVILELNSNLGTCQPIYLFRFNCGNQEEAELLKRHLREEFNKFKAKIASEPEYYLDSYSISKLKRRLKDWNGKEHHWK